MEINSLDGTNVNQFVENLRASLQDSYDASMANLENQKMLDNASIMSNANKAGVMYSNFPEREKIKYQTNTYIPAAIKNYQAYQTGLDSLRNNSLNILNTIRSTEKAIAELNAS